MELVASSCEKNFGIPVVRMLQKEGRSVQKELDRSQRMESARHSFNVVKNFHLPEKRDVIVVLDDVSTTGATIRSCVEIVEQTIALPVVGLCITMD
jgi:predicted amidophosphoribosyltransferase